MEKKPNASEKALRDEIRRMIEEVYMLEEGKKKKPSEGLTKKKKSAVAKKARKGGDIGHKGKGFKDIVAKAKSWGADDPEAVAAAAMWKNIKR